MATLNLGRIKPVFQGAYNNSTAYIVDDIVTFGDETFICIQASTGNATSNASYWTKLAAKGTDGTDVGTTITTQGDILYRDGSGLARLGAGTSGQFLKTQGTGANPVWGTVVSKILGTSFITYGTRISGIASPSHGSGYSGTANIFPSNTWQYTKTIQNSHLQGWLTISGMDGGSHEHGRGTLSFSIDGSTLTNKQTVATAVNTQSNYPNHSTAMFKVANNVSAGTITIDPRYGGNGSKFWEIINPNQSDHNEYDVTTACHMFIMEVAN